MLNFNLDLQKQDNFSKAFTARMGDVGEQFSVTLFDNQTPYVPVNGDVVSFRVVTPSGKFASVAGTMSGNKATFTLNGQITSEAGYYQRAYVAVSNGTKLRTTQDLIFFSLGNSDINRGQADYYVAELDKLLQQLNEEFDEWLKDREKDYSDLLARIVALTNRVTGLETKLDDILAQLQANMINTTNVFDTSLITMPENQTRRRIGDNVFELNGWAIGMFDNKSTLAMLEPNKTYHTHFIAELMTLNGGELYPVTSNASFALYSGADFDKYPTIWIAQGKTIDFREVKVGDKVERSTTFTTPANLADPAANYRILGYSRRDTNGVTDMLRIYDMIIQEGSMWTGFQVSPDDTLTSYEQDSLLKSILLDPKMTGTNPPTVENGSDGKPTMEVSYLTTGEMLIKNLLTTGRARVYWTAAQLGLSVDEMKQPFNIKFKMRHNGTSGTRKDVEIGYSGQTTNPIFAVGSVMDTYVATIQSTVNTALCIYVGAGDQIVIKEGYVYPANTDITSTRINIIETTLATVERSTIGNPEILSNVDLNTVTRAGNYVAYQPTNAPISGAGIYWYLQVYGFDNNNRNYLQVLTMRSGKNRRYFRQQVNSTWQEWRWIPDIFSDGRVDTISDDFNNQKETGQYVITTTSNSPTGAASTSWYLEVIRYGSSGNYILQKTTQISNTNRVTYQRQFFNGTWTQWDLVYGSYVPITDTNDANLYVTTQNILLRDAAASNLPTTTGSNYYYVEVIARAANYVMQRATLRSTDFKVYVRQNVSGTWSPWREMAFL